jgi:hypothetical protein
VAQSPLGGGSGRFLGFVGMEGDLFAGGAAASFQERSLQRPVGHALFTGSFRARAVRLALLQLNNVHVTTQILRFRMNGSKVPCPSRCRWDIFRLEEGRIVLRAGNMHFCMDRQVNSPVADSKFSYHPLKLIMIINCDPDIYIEPPNLDGDY